MSDEGACRCNGFPHTVECIESEESSSLVAGAASGKGFTPETAVKFLREQRAHLWVADEGTLEHRRACTALWDEGCHYLQAVETLERFVAGAAGRAASSDLSAVIADMRLASAAVDEAAGTSDYTARLVGLALIARHYLRELPLTDRSVSPRLGSEKE